MTLKHWFPILGAGLSSMLGLYLQNGGIDPVVGGIHVVTFGLVVLGVFTRSPSDTKLTSGGAS